MDVIKEDGTREKFDADKLRRSIRKSMVDSGQSVDEKTVNKIENKVKEKAKDGMTTEAIRRIVFDKLEETNPDAKEAWLRFDARFKGRERGISAPQRDIEIDDYLPTFARWSDLWPRLARGRRGFRMPMSDVRETESNVIADIELPGVDREDIRLNLTNDCIEVTTTKKEEKSEKGSYFYSGRSYCRRIPLSTEVDADNASARFSNGVLHIEIPKKGERQTKKVSIT